jgi:hypothetical protein
MEYVIGAVLALAVSALATGVGFERDRAFYPTVLIVIASYYDLFGVMGGSIRALSLEVAGTTAFLLVAIFGFKRNLWWVVGALVGHGVFDFFHAQLITDPGVPTWWPMFCLTFDVVAGAYLAWRLSAANIPARAETRR